MRYLLLRLFFLFQLFFFPAYAFSSSEDLESKAVFLSQKDALYSVLLSKDAYVRATAEFKNEPLWDSFEKKLLDDPVTRDSQLMWVGLSENQANLVYVVARGDELYVVIRGTVLTSIENIIEDLLIVQQVQWIGSVNSFVRISKGISLALDQILNTSFVDRLGNTATLRDIVDQAYKKNPSLSVTVTGHSLGGALSIALGVWLSENFSSLDDAIGIRVIAFGSQAFANLAFAQYVEERGRRLGAKFQVYRLVNPYDMVPSAVGSLSNFFKQPYPFTRNLLPLINIALNNIIPFILFNVDYTNSIIQFPSVQDISDKYEHIGRSIPIREGLPDDRGCGNVVDSISKLFCWLSAQHKKDYYVELIREIKLKGLGLSFGEVPSIEIR